MLKFLLLCFVGLCFNFPILKHRGTHYECFHEIGKTFKKEISTFVETYEHMNLLTSWYKKHKTEYKQYYDIINTYYPYVIDELKGTADGSGIDFEIIFLMNLENEIRGYLPIEMQHEPYFIPHCTDVHINKDPLRLIGHNEDGPVQNKNSSYIVQLEIVDEKGEIEEKLVSYCYPGVIPGLAYAYNYHGMTFSMNAVTPAYIQMGVPKFALNRDVLKSKTFEEAIMRAVNPKYQRSFGHSIHLGSINSGRRTMIELAPSESAVYEIHGNYSHMNNYRKLNIDFVSEPSSVHRLKRMDELSAPKTKQDILDRLGDTKDEDLPIYRKYTLCTALYNLNDATMEVYDENPSFSKPIHKFNMKDIM